MPVPHVTDRSGQAFQATRARLDVLLVEDDDSFADVVVRMLESSGMGLPDDWPDTELKVMHVTDLKGARAALREQPFQIIIADLDIPDSKGAATIQAIRDVAPEPPILVLSGRDDVPTALDATNAGADGYVAKDELSPKRLARAIAMALLQQSMHTHA